MSALISMNALGNYMGCAKPWEKGNKNLQYAPNKKPNIIVFGPSGVGKTAFINLLIGGKVLPESAGTHGCTFDATRVEFENFNIWDTAGIDEGESENATVTTPDAVKNLIVLMKGLRAGVSLLILVGSTRTTEAIRQNHGLFYEAICDHKVPMIYVKTHCDSVNEGDFYGKWRAENESSIKADLPGVVHAFGLTTQFTARFKEIRDEAEQGKADVLIAIESLSVSAFKWVNLDKWIMRVIKFLFDNFAKFFTGAEIPWNAGLVQLLISLFHWPAEVATEVANDAIMDDSVH